MTTKTIALAILKFFICIFIVYKLVSLPIITPTDDRIFMTAGVIIGIATFCDILLLLATLFANSKIKTCIKPNTDIVNNNLNSSQSTWTDEYGHQHDLILDTSKIPNKKSLKQSRKKIKP